VRRAQVDLDDEVDASGSGSLFEIAVSGDQMSLPALLGMLDNFSPTFNIVTPATQ